MRVAVIGLGRVGRPLAQALEQAGCDVAWMGRKETSAGKHADLTDFQVAFLTAPDQQVPVLAAQVRKWPGHSLAHCSGQLPNAKLGADAAMFHPLMSFRGDETADAFKGCPIGISGPEDNLPVLIDLAEKMGSVPFTIAEGHKMTYHLAAMFASVFPYILLMKCRELAQAAGIPPERHGAIFGPIFKRAADHLRLEDPVQGITGPVSRQDGPTLRQHMLLLSHDPDGQALYRILTKLSIDYASLQGEAQAELMEAIA